MTSRRPSVRPSSSSSTAARSPPTTTWSRSWTRRVNDNYSTRAANAAYCVADESKEAFRRFHAALFAQQPEEGAGAAPDNAKLIETARQAGAGGSVPDCVNYGKYNEMVDGLAAAAKITATPTIKLNGEDISPATPDDLVAKVNAIVGDVPALERRATGAIGSGPRSAVSVETPAPVEPTGSAESPRAAGCCGAAGQRVVGADRRCHRLRGGG